MRLTVSTTTPTATPCPHGPTVAGYRIQSARSGFDSRHPSPFACAHIVRRVRPHPRAGADCSGRLPVRFRRPAPALWAEADWFSVPSGFEAHPPGPVTVYRPRVTCSNGRDPIGSLLPIFRIPRERRCLSIL
jgi:hypothetical protein